MAESGNGSPRKIKFPGDSSGEQMSSQMRLLLAFGLMGLVLFVTQYFLPKPSPPPKKTEVVKTETKAAPAPEPAAAKPAAATPGPDSKPKKSAPASAAPETKSAAAEQIYVVETDLYRVTFSNRGASIRSWILKKYKDNNGKPVDLVHSAAAAKVGWPFSYWAFPETKPTTDLNASLFAVSQSDPLSIDFEFSDGQTKARKTFKFEPKVYRSSLRSEVAVGAQPAPHLLTWRGGFGDQTAYSAASTQHSVRYETAGQKLVVQSAGDASKGPLRVEGAFDFAGLEDTYFAGVLLPEAGSSINFVTLSDKLAVSGGSETEYVGVSFGDQGSHGATLFFGPKDTDTLRATNPRLQTLIDWGWFWFIAKPLFLTLHWTSDVLTSNWGWAIVFVTVIINLLMLPLRFSQLRSTQKMAVIQPEIAAIQARYKNVPMRDPRKQKQNEEMMALYQKHGINPMGGCVPLLLQMPFFIAFYKVLSVAIELRSANWLWIADLSQPEMSWFRVLPIAMLVSQVVMQKMTPVTSPDPSQQRMMMIMMPIMLTFMFYNASSGLVLYWLTGNVVGIVQQYFFNRLAHPAPAHNSPKKK